MKRLAGLFIVGCLMLLVHPVQAHDGLRNAQGCHTDNDGTNYHCHKEKKGEGEAEKRTSSTILESLKSRAKEAGWSVKSKGEVVRFNRTPFSVKAQSTFINVVGTKQRTVGSKEFKIESKGTIKVLGESHQLYIAQSGKNGSGFYLVSLPTSKGFVELTAAFLHDDEKIVQTAFRQLVNPSLKESKALREAKLAAPKSPLFREHKWGATLAEVKKKEGKPELETEDSLAYKDTLAGKQVLVFFYFHDDSFYQGAYSFSQDYVNAEKHLRDYLGIQDLLEKKYGSSEKSIRRRDDNQYTDMSTELTMGLLLFGNDWKVGDVEVVHLVYGEEFEVTHLLRYKNLKVSKEAEKAARSETDSKL